MHEVKHKEGHDDRKGSPIAHLLVGLLIGAALTLGVIRLVDEPAQTTTPTASQSQGDDSMAAMVDGLRDKKGDDFDQAFVEAMIPHHKSAVEMALLIDGRTDRAEIKKLGEDIVAAQNSEIDQMTRWYADWGFGTYDDTGGMDHSTTH